jgi:Predicted glycosyltransferase
MRMVVDAPVTLMISGEQIDAICRDLSANGMAIDLPKPLPDGIELLVSLATASNALPPFQAQARVVRGEPKGSSYQIGVEFIAVS